MSVSEGRIDDRVAGLREAFDRSFMHALVPKPSALENLLAIRMGPDRYVLRLDEISGLFADKKVTWLPSPVVELLGIAGVRGTVLPVYDLGMLLGLPKATTPRWLVVTAVSPVGLMFEAFDGYLAARADALVPEVCAETRQRHVRQVLQAEVARPVIHLPSVLETIRKSGETAVRSKS